MNYEEMNKTIKSKVKLTSRNLKKSQQDIPIINSSIFCFTFILKEHYN